MITDMVRNDLGRVAEPGTVKTSALFATERYPHGLANDVASRSQHER